MEQLSKSAKKELRQAAKEFKYFTRHLLHIEMRPYQVEAANEILNSIYDRDGRSFVIIFSRQSGKDELLANLFLYLMLRLYDMNASIVCAQPTFKPQTVNAMERLRNRGTQYGRRLARTAGYIMRFETTRLLYFSTDPSANVVGATADRLLVINEAQDVDKSVYDKRFSPMAASGNATKVFSGTTWTSDTLLERERQLAEKAERADGLRRIFMVDADEVARSNEWYGKFVKAEIEKLGRQHPLIKSQYFNEIIDKQAGMFNPGRRALMQGDQPTQEGPTEGRTYAFLIDVAGQDEALLNLDGMGNPGRDSTSLSIAEVDLSMLDTLQAPIYHIVKRIAWKGVSHMQIFGALAATIAQWNPQHIVVDATGVGEGLWAMLDKSHPSRVIPVKFSQQEKSEIGWRFLAIVETGRFRDCCMTDEVRIQYDKCQSEILPGPAKTLRWGVKDGTRDAEGQLVHDDIILSDALCAKLDELEWTHHSETLFTQPKDFMKDADHAY